MPVVLMRGCRVSVMRGIDVAILRSMGSPVEARAVPEQMRATCMSPHRVGC
jgi:hypothetical protein